MKGEINIETTGVSEILLKNLVHLLGADNALKFGRKPPQTNKVGVN